jgi:hypothetical protein
VDNVVRIFSYDGTLLKEINKGSPKLLKLSRVSLFVALVALKMILFYILSERRHLFASCIP